MSKTSSKGVKKSNEEVLAGFQALRAEQRQLGSKISELQMELNEHKIVIETLRGVEPDRRCFRSVGGVLLQRSAGAALAELQATSERMPPALQRLEEQLAQKGEEINRYIERHDIRIQRADRPPPAPAAAEPKPNVLVAQ